MADDDRCPTSHCRRPMRRGSLLCRRCWYVVPDDLKQTYFAARAALNHDKTVHNLDAMLDAKQRMIESVTPRGNPS